MDPKTCSDLPHKPHKPDTQKNSKMANLRFSGLKMRSKMSFLTDLVFDFFDFFSVFEVLKGPKNIWAYIGLLFSKIAIFTKILRLFQNPSKPQKVKKSLFHFFLKSRFKKFKIFKMAKSVIFCKFDSKLIKVIFR